MRNCSEMTGEHCLRHSKGTGSFASKLGLEKDEKATISKDDGTGRQTFEVRT